MKGKQSSKMVEKKGKGKEQNPPKKAAKSTKSTKEHKNLKDKLQEEDPEFYEFLKDQDQSLLDFDAFGDGDDEEIDSDEEDNENEDDGGM